MSASRETWRAAVYDRAAWQWPIAQWLVASSFLALALAIFLLVRRASGALIAPLPPLALFATAAGLYTWVWSVRLAWSCRANRDSIVSRHTDRMIIVWLPQLALMLVAVACSYPGRRVVDWLAWLPVIVANSVGSQVVARWRQSRVDSAAVVPPAATIALRTYPSLPAAAADLSAATDDPGIMLQQLNRSRAPDGRETVHGTLVAEFAPEERTTALHVAFCPPFETLPHVEVEVADGPDASVKVAQVLHNGARIEVRLSEPVKTSTAVLLAIAAEGHGN
ncbi:MAG TPA: hypothetical protein VGM76_18820 [Lacipirellulaceae bacterium]|jgi:hypothetical protein